MVNTYSLVNTWWKRKCWAIAPLDPSISARLVGEALCSLCPGLVFRDLWMLNSLGRWRECLPPKQMPGLCLLGVRSQLPELRVPLWWQAGSLCVEVSFGALHETLWSLGHRELSREHAYSLDAVTAGSDPAISRLPSAPMKLRQAHSSAQK